MTKLVRETKGWTNGYGVEATMWFSPDGTVYAECRNGERPDLILQSKRMKKWGLAPLELRLYDTSSLQRKVKRARRQVKKGMKSRGRVVRKTL